MSDFNLAIGPVLQHEGGLVDHPSDPGGLTNFGISKKWADSQGLCLDIKNLTVDQAKELYKKYFWDPYPYHEIADQKVATKSFDMAVNMGAIQAHKLIQRAVANCGLEITIDGQLGPKSVALINSIPAPQMLSSIVQRQRNFYIALATQKPSLAVFLKGWLRRADWTG
jgi:lysozyme family protein